MTTAPVAAHRDGAPWDEGFGGWGMSEQAGRADTAGLHAFGARHPKAATNLAAVALLGAGYLLAWAVHQVWFAGEPPFQVAGGISVFAVLFALALAIERIVQPFSASLGPDSSAARRALLAVAQEHDGGPGRAARLAEAKAALDDARDKTAVVTWGAASGLGFVLSSALNVTLLGIVLASGQQPWYWVDLLVTGLVVGAGTKPLNDLATRLQDKGTGV